MDRVRGLLKSAAALGALALLGWLGGSLYWHFRLLGAIRTLEARSGPQGTDQAAYDAVHDAGCRALPYLAGSVASRNPSFQSLAAGLFKHALQGPLSRGEAGLSDKLSGWMIDAEASPAERQKKAEEIQAWWRGQGERRHSRWRWWSGDCGGI